MKKLKVSVKLVEVKRKHTKKEPDIFTLTEMKILCLAAGLAGLCLGTCVTLWTR